MPTKHFPSLWNTNKIKYKYNWRHIFCVFLSLSRSFFRLGPITHSPCKTFMASLIFCTSIHQPSTKYLHLPTLCPSTSRCNLIIITAQILQRHKQITLITRHLLHVHFTYLLIYWQQHRAICTKMMTMMIQIFISFLSMSTKPRNVLLAMCDL